MASEENNARLGAVDAKTAGADFWAPPIKITGTTAGIARKSVKAEIDRRPSKQLQSINSVSNLGLPTILTTITEKMAGPVGGIYNFLFRNNIAFLATVFTGAFAFEITYDSAWDKIWDNANRGRQWKDIRSRYIEGGSDDE